MKILELRFVTTFSIFFLFINNFVAQSSEPQTVIIRAFELFSGKESKMNVTTPDGSIVAMELGVINVRDYEGNVGNSVIIQSEINYWKKYGFVINGFSSSQAPNGIVTTIILSK